MKLSPFKKSIAAQIVQELSYLKGTSHKDPNGKYLIVFDITIYPLDPITNAGNKLLTMYQERIYNTGVCTKEDTEIFLQDFEEDEEYDVKFILISRNDLDNRFYKIRFQSVGLISTANGMQYGLSI